MLYYFDARHKAIACSNIKKAFGDKLSLREISQVTRDFYQSFGQTIMEVFLFPFVDKSYLDKYVDFDKVENIFAGLKMGKGVILAVIHEGSWEMSNMISSNLGYPYNVIVREQPKYPRLNNLLNLYRSQKGSKLIRRQNQTKEIIRVLKDNEAIAMTIDQGGKDGVIVDFFGSPASMSTGAIRLALKLGAAIIPVFLTRTNGPYIKLFLDPPFEIKKTGDTEKDVAENLQRLVNLYEKYLTLYPKEYLWTYKIWKYGRAKNILILSDGKVGHLRQAQGLGEIVSSSLKERNEIANVQTIEIRFRNKISRSALALGTVFGGKYSCQGCLWCLRKFLDKDIYAALIKAKPDIIISCGSSVAPVNFVLSRQNLAKSLVVMRPALLSTKRFDLVVMSRHDQAPKRKNIVVIDGALNLIDDEYLKSQGQSLAQKVNIAKEFVLGLLIGGDTKDFKLSEGSIRKLIAQVKESLEKFDGEVLITTSRRTPANIERLLKEEFKDHPRCKLLIIANEKNIPEAVGGILALSRVIITSPESISMICEAVNSKKHVLVFKSPGLSRKHERFLAHFAENKYIYLAEANNLSKTINDAWLTKPQVHTLKDNDLVKEAIGRLL